MPSIDREDIHIISRNSNWSAQGVQKALEDRVYNDQPAWHKFLKILFLSLGVGFTTTGIVFFFAYNWDSLHKFVKIGLIEGLVIITTLIIAFTRINLLTKQIILTGTSVLVGVLMAVFGQVYQTGANAYDLFFGWTSAITLWTAIANFPPLWLVYIILVNTTFSLYAQQVANDWPSAQPYLLLTLINSAFLLGALLIGRYKTQYQPPSWFITLQVLWMAILATWGIMTGIFDPYSHSFLILVLATILLCTAGIWYGLKQKSLFYLSVIPFSVIVIISALLIKLSNDSGMFLFTALFIIASITFLVKILLNTQKKWAHERSA